MIKPRRTKYQWVDSKWVQLFHELREVREKFVVYIYFRYVSMSATMVEAILNPNTEERPVETAANKFNFFLLLTWNTTRLSIVTRGLNLIHL